MESSKELVERIEGDVDNLLDMYNLAEKAYPYSKLNGGRNDNENQQRKSNTKYLT